MVKVDFFKASWLYRIAFNMAIDKRHTSLYSFIILSFPDQFRSNPQRFAVLRRQAESPMNTAMTENAQYWSTMHTLLFDFKIVYNAPSMAAVLSGEPALACVIRKHCWLYFMTRKWCRTHFNENELTPLLISRLTMHPWISFCSHIYWL